MVAPEADPETTTARSDRRLLSIDALRGAAALAVVLCHSSLSFGYVGVYLFFVISGFCIHLRWAKAVAGGAPARVDFWEFWKRRTIRLYPPYAVAVLLSLALLASRGSLPAPRFLAFDLVLHATMLHNFTEATKRSLNPVFWTLAVEEQLYLAYFLMLALRVRLGWRWTLGICLLARVLWIPVALSVNAFLAGVVPAGLLLPLQEGAAWHWFVWVLGALSVEAWLGVVRLPAWLHSPAVSALALSAAATLTYLQRAADGSTLAGSLATLPVHPLWGLGFFVMMNGYVRGESRWQRPGIAAAATRALADIGLMSYSLYLTHTLVLGFFANELTQWLVIPAALAFAWMFFVLVERPFIRLARKTASRASR